MNTYDEVRARRVRQIQNICTDLTGSFSINHAHYLYDLEKRLEKLEEQSNIGIDFDGDDLISLGKACKELNLTFSEFIIKAVEDMVERLEKEDNEL